MFGAKVKIDKELLARAEEFAAKAGYSSVEEFVAHAVEKAMSKSGDSGTDDEIKKKLQGLGYIS